MYQFIQLKRYKTTRNGKWSSLNTKQRMTILASGNRTVTKRVGILTCHKILSED